MALYLKINGQPYTHFTSASVSASIATVSRGFSFVSTADEGNNFPIKVGDEVEITADGVKILAGYVENLDISYDANNHSIQVGGRSKMADLIDSSVPTQFEVTGTTLEAIAKSLLSAIGIDGKVINQAGDIKSFSGNITSAQVGEIAFSFLEKYSRKRQVLLTTDGDDGLVFARTGTTKAPISLKNVNGAADNNILRSNLRIDSAKRFYRYKIKAQANPLAFLFAESAESTSNKEGEAFDKDIRESRKLELNSETSTESFTAGQRALWEKNIRIGSAFYYQAKVVGNSFDGSILLPNTLIRVVDDFAQIDATLLIKNVQYDFDAFSGSTTDLTMIKRESYTLEVEQSQRVANAQKTDQEKLI